MIKYSKGYFYISIVLFIIEVLIAIYAHDDFIRPYFGDFLVVILLYCMLKSFLSISPLQATTAVLLFSYLIEFLQYVDIVNQIGLESSKLANVVIGNYFTWNDMLAYTLGAVTVLVVEWAVDRKQYN